MADGGELPLPPPRPPPPSAPLPSEARGAARRARAAAGVDVGQAGGGTSRRVTRRGQPPPPPSPSALRETTGVTCAQCNHKKAKCEKMVPCDRCWRLELPCRPYLRAAGGGAEPRELMSAADEVAERVLGCTDLGALAEQMAGAFRLGEVDPTRAGALLRAWAGLSALAQRDATHGVLPAVGRLFGLGPAEMRFGPTTDRETMRADLAAERARAEAAGARLRRLQGYRLEDDGRAALHLLVLEESEDGVEEAGAPPFRVAHATNAAYDAAFAWRGEGVAEAECARRVMNPLLFAVYLDPAERPLFFRLLVAHLCFTGTAPPPSSSHLVKVFDCQGQVRLFLLTARGLNPASPLAAEPPPSSEEGEGEVTDDDKRDAATAAASAAKPQQPLTPRVLSGLFLRLEPVHSKYVSGRPLSRCVVQRFQPKALASAASAAAAGGAAAGPDREREEGQRLTEKRKKEQACVPGLACPPLRPAELDGAAALVEVAHVLFAPQWAPGQPVMVLNPGLIPPVEEEDGKGVDEEGQEVLLGRGGDDDDEEEEAAAVATAAVASGGRKQRGARQRAGGERGATAGAGAAQGGGKQRKGGRRKQQREDPIEETQAKWRERKGKGGGKKRPRPTPPSSPAPLPEEKPRRRFRWEDGNALASALVMVTPPSPPLLPSETTATAAAAALHYAQSPPHPLYAHAQGQAQAALQPGQDQPHPHQHHAQQPPPQPQQQQQRARVAISPLLPPDFLFAPVAGSPQRTSLPSPPAALAGGGGVGAAGVPVPELTVGEMEAIFDRPSDAGERLSDASLRMAAAAAAAALAGGEGGGGDGGGGGYAAVQQQPVQLPSPYAHFQGGEQQRHEQQQGGWEQGQQWERAQRMEQLYQEEVRQHRQWLNLDALSSPQQPPQQHAAPSAPPPPPTEPSPWAQPLQPPTDALGLPQRRLPPASAPRQPNPRDPPPPGLQP